MPPTLSALAAEVAVLREIVARQAEQIETLTQTDANLLSARSIIQDGPYLAQLRGFVSAERAGIPAQQKPVAAILCSQEGMLFMDENGLLAPLAVAYGVDDDGRAWMFPRAQK